MSDELREDFITALSAEWLKSRGYKVEPDIRYQEFVTPSTLARRLNIGASSIHEKLHDATCPRFEAEYGPSGRLVKLRLNDHLREYLGL